jgi:hypothetical protein
MSILLLIAVVALVIGLGRDVEIMPDDLAYAHA